MSKNKLSDIRAYMIGREAAQLQAARAMLAALVEMDAALCGGFETQTGRMAGRRALIKTRAAIAQAKAAGIKAEG